MTELSEATREKVRQLFPAEQRDDVVRILEEECGESLPLMQGPEKLDLMERVRFAALKESGGKVNLLREAVHLAQIDWRDLLINAGFADSVDAHRHWTID